jgi:hypothetical protein
MQHRLTRLGLALLEQNLGVPPRHGLSQLPYTEAG